MADNYAMLLRDIFLLLDFLETVNDNRLLAQFDDTRPKSGAPSPIVATPPCNSYHEFLRRLSEAQERVPPERPQGQPTEASELEDLAFLRWSRNFLASVAAPATVDSILTTRQFIQERARVALTPPWKSLWNWVVRRFRSSPQPDANENREIPRDENPSRGAKWLARSARRLERGLLLITILTVMVSAYAMVGKYISDQRTGALDSYQNAANALYTDIPSLWKAQPGESIVQFVNKFESTCSISAPPADMTGTPVKKVADSSGPDNPATAENAGSTTGPGNPDVATIDAAVKLLRDCREYRRAKYRLAAEDIRLRSWQSIFMGRWDWWSPGDVASAMVGSIVGWSDSTLVRAGAAFDEPFCNDMKEDYDLNQNCREVVRGVVEGTGSMSSAILGCISLYLVPALYSLIGSGAATMRYLRHRVEASTLSVTDRARIAYNAILGFAFGAIIGLFARYLGSESNIGPAVVALLAGFNVPAVFAFLGELSNRVFGTTEAAGVTK